MTLGEMLRQERFGAGMADQKDLDAQFAKAIMGDTKFEVGTGLISQIRANLGYHRMTSNIWTIMQPSWVVRKCVRMQ
jgi:hypothetical protein